MTDKPADIELRQLKTALRFLGDFLVAEGARHTVEAADPATTIRDRLVALAEADRLHGDTLRQLVAVVEALPADAAEGHVRAAGLEALGLARELQPAEESKAD